MLFFIYKIYFILLKHLQAEACSLFNLRFEIG